LGPAVLDDPYCLYGACGPPFVPAALRGQRFADLANPFEPIERIEALGYVHETVTGEASVVIGAALRSEG
jgi:hypothetical protein